MIVDPEPASRYESALTEFAPAASTGLAGVAASGARHARSEPRLMLPHDFASMLEQFAIEVEQLPGVSRTRPHAFAEAKSELTHKMRVRAKELRTVPTERKPLPMLRAGAITVPGLGVSRERRVAVEVRGRRRA